MVWRLLQRCYNYYKEHDLSVWFNNTANDFVMNEGCGYESAAVASFSVDVVLKAP